MINIETIFIFGERKSFFDLRQNSMTVTIWEMGPGSPALIWLTQNSFNQANTKYRFYWMKKCQTKCHLQNPVPSFRHKGSLVRLKSWNLPEQTCDANADLLEFELNWFCSIPACLWRAIHSLGEIIDMFLDFKNPNTDYSQALVFCRIRVKSFKPSWHNFYSTLNCSKRFVDWSNFKITVSTAEKNWKSCVWVFLQAVAHVVQILHKLLHTWT